MSQELIRPTDIVIDLETLGHRGNAAIISIGAASFNRYSFKDGSTFYATIDLEDAMRFGAITARTLRFWLKPENAAALQGLLAHKPALRLFDALRGLSDYVRGHLADVKVWGNGSSFDISILEHAYDAIGYDHRYAGLTEGWMFWNIRDLRTAVDLADFEVRKNGIPFTGIKHHALHDAQHEVKVLKECLRALHGEPEKAPAQPAKAESEDW